MRKPTNPLSHKAFRAVSFSATKDKKLRELPKKGGSRNFLFTCKLLCFVKTRSIAHVLLTLKWRP